jgi:hypothetical protein
MAAGGSQLPRVGSWVPSSGICRPVVDRQIRSDLPEPPRGSARPPGGRDLRTLLAMLSAGILHRGERMATLRWIAAGSNSVSGGHRGLRILRRHGGRRQHPVFNAGVRPRSSIRDEHGHAPVIGPPASAGAPMPNQPARLDPGQPLPAPARRVGDHRRHLPSVQRAGSSSGSSSDGRISFIGSAQLDENVYRQVHQRPDGTSGCWPPGDRHLSFVALHDAVTGDDGPPQAPGSRRSASTLPRLRSMLRPSTSRVSSTPSRASSRASRQAILA